MIGFMSKMPCSVKSELTYVPTDIKIFCIKGDSRTADVRSRVQKLGIKAIEIICPSSMADWVELPFIYDTIYGSYYGDDGITAFIARIQRHVSQIMGR